MKKHVWAEAALLVALPLGGAWYFWHGYVLIAVALMAAAFAFIVGSQICARREIRQKQQQLKGSAERDGRYLAEHINHFGQLQPSPRGELPAEFLRHLEALLSEARDQSRSRSSSPAPISSLILRPSSQAIRHSSIAKQEQKEKPLDEIAHCDEPMKLVRVIPKTEILPELKVFKCSRCGHVKTQEERAIE
jgi:hypothetical protein